MRTRRFHLTSIEPGIRRVDGAEAEHALRVLRLKTGDRVLLFDGHGIEADGEIVATQDAWFEVQVSNLRSGVEPGRIALILAVAAPKGERADWLVEKCAEFGVSAVRWIETRRGQVIPGAGKLERWRRKAVEAAKQAGHAVLMDVAGPMPIESVVASQSPDRVFLYCDPDLQTPLIDRAREIRSMHPAPSAVVIFVGPEGGFTPEEVTCLQSAGAMGVRLCDSILRIETAAVAAAAIWFNTAR